VLAAALALAAAGCDTGATSLGPILDEDLDLPEAQDALVTGMSLTLSRALNHVALTGAAVSFEVAASGSVGGFGITIRQRGGHLDPDPDETDIHWRLAQQARWVAEDGARRLRRVLGEDFAASPAAARALLYAGYANRLLGENMCEAVIDGGPRQPRTVSLQRAEAAFTEALAVAEASGETGIASAARAGRASVRAWLGNWAGAEADAAAVPPGFTFDAVYDDTAEDLYNRVQWSNVLPNRAHTVFTTFYDAYYTATGDPRTPWEEDPDFPVGDNGLPWHFQTKYTDRTSPIHLSSHREMRLLIAEARLRSGDVPGATAILVQLRTDLGLAPWEADTLEEAWAALRRERGIELWLEGRRLGDLYRWNVEGIPGAAEDLTGRDTCFPIGQTEVDANPNL
jgi:hypothetical protein